MNGKRSRYPSLSPDPCLCHAIFSNFCNKKISGNETVKTLKDSHVQPALRAVVSPGRTLEETTARRVCPALTMKSRVFSLLT